MVRKNQEEKQIENEERFRFVNIEDYQNKNFQAFNKVDTLEYIAEQVFNISTYLYRQ
jgi:hypothetical protein